MWREVRAGGRRKAGRARLKAWGPRARAERTLNMLLMSVTTEVSQLDTSALKFCTNQKSLLMSETPETSQSATGPYVAMADAVLSLTAWTPVFREAVLVKMPGGDGGGEGGDGGGLGDGEIVGTIEMPLGNELAL